MDTVPVTVAFRDALAGQLRDRPLNLTTSTARTLVTTTIASLLSPSRNSYTTCRPAIGIRTHTLP